MRGKQAPKRLIKPDIKYHRVDVAKFINYIMERGKKSVAEQIMYDALQIISDKTKLDPLTIFEGALRNVEPVVEVRSRRVGGGNYQIPVNVRPERRYYLACKWLLDAARDQKGRPMCERLADELMKAERKEGAAFKKREDVYRMAEANRAFAHLARF